jgi:hypothetical protein
MGVTKPELLRALIRDLRISEDIAKHIVSTYPAELVLQRISLQFSSIKAGIRYTDIGNYTIMMLEQMLKMVSTKPKPLPSFQPIGRSAPKARPPRVVMKAYPEVASKHLNAMREFLKGV